MHIGYLLKMHCSVFNFHGGCQVFAFGNVLPYAARGLHIQQTYLHLNHYSIAYRLLLINKKLIYLCIVSVLVEDFASEFSCARVARQCNSVYYICFVNIYSVFMEYKSPI